VQSVFFWKGERVAITLDGGRMGLSSVGGMEGRSMTEQEWLVFTDPKPMLEFLRGMMSNRKLLLFACACCDRIQHIINDARSRSALSTLRRAADGLADDGEVAMEVESSTQASGAAIVAVCIPILGLEECVRMSRQARSGYDPFDIMARHEPAVNAAWAVEYAIRSIDPALKAWQFGWRLQSQTAMIDRISVSARFAAQVVALLAVPDPGCQETALIEALRSEAAAQAILLRETINPFHRFTIKAVWLTPTVLALAQAAYDNRILPAGRLDNARLATLADALEDAGCDNAEILNHCRGPGPHVRGCWVLDLILAKE
jgi:hypothetical protein